MQIDHDSGPEFFDYLEPQMCGKCEQMLWLDGEYEVLELPGGGSEIKAIGRWVAGGPGDFACPDGGDHEPGSPVDRGTRD